MRVLPSWRRLLLALPLAAGVLTAPAFARAEDDPGRAARLFVADAQSHVLTVLDATGGQTLASFGTPGRIGNVVASSSGRWVYLVHSDHNRVTVLDSGLRLEDHGDHLDLAMQAPHVRGTVFTGRRPIDFWVGHGLATVHNDDDGTLAVFDDERLELAPDYTEVRGAGTGHNNAVVMDDTVLLSLASEGSVTAYGLHDNAVRARFEGCPGTHGWATPTRTLAAAGCTDGVMVFSKTGDTVAAHKIAEPAGSPENARVSTLRAHRAAPVMIGNFGQGLAIVRPDAAELQPVPLPSNPVRFELDHDGERLVVLTLDGRVQALEPTSGQVLWSVAAVTPVDSTATARPSLAVGEDVAYATDPATGEIVAIDLASGARRVLAATGGTPTGIALVLLEGVEHA